MSQSKALSPPSKTLSPLPNAAAERNEILESERHMSATSRSRPERQRERGPSSPMHETADPWSVERDKLRKVSHLSPKAKPRSIGLPTTPNEWRLAISKSPEDGRDSARPEPGSSSHSGSISRRRLEKAKARATGSPTRKSTRPVGRGLDSVAEEAEEALASPLRQAASPGHGAQTAFRQPFFGVSPRPSPQSTSLASASQPTRACFSSSVST